MDQEGPFRCEYMPGVRSSCRAGATPGPVAARRPSLLQGEKYFRGSSRELPFGAFPSVGAFPLVCHDD